MNTRSPRLAARILRANTFLATDVRVASSLWARFRGLMWRDRLAPGEGLWLPGDASIHMLFMRFPIDAVFLAPVRPGEAPARSDMAGDPAAPGAALHRVVAVRTLQPWTGIVPYVRGARGCLELAAGAAEAAGLQEDDEVVLGPA